MQDSQSVPIEVTLSSWVAEASADPVKHQERQVTEILLHAIGISALLQEALVLKGGILMSLVHGSYRQTGDIDFTAIVDPEPYAQELKATLNRALVRAAADLGYTDTPMTARLNVAKADPREIVAAIYDGLEAGDSEVLADEVSRQVKQGLSQPLSVLYPELTAAS